jgi:hypothetical protein
LFLLIGVTSAWAAPVDKQISYKKATTLAYPKNYTIRFSLWDDPTAGTEVWSEEKTIKLTTSSTIKTNLGDVNPLDPADFSQQLWVQVEKLKADGITYVPVGERDKLVASPYAIATAQSGYVAVQAYGFVPEDSTTTWDGYLPTNGFRAITGGTLKMAAPISFPEGATLTELSADIYDTNNNPGDYVTVNLYRSEGNSSVLIGTVGTTDVEDVSFEHKTSIINHTVSYANATGTVSYYLEWEQPASTNIMWGPGLYAVRVKYSY